MTNRPKTLYHYCSTETFLSIISNKTIWLSDVGKSNDRSEMLILRKRFYEYIFRKYHNATDKNEIACCKFLLAVATTDGLEEEVPLLNRMDLAAEYMNHFRALRAYCFCLTELKDSLGQWRGYADNGCGLNIGFSHKFLNNISGKGLFCPISNFYLSSVRYEKNDMDEVCDIIYDSCEKSSPPEFLSKVLAKLFHLSILFKNRSFMEEEEWRIIFTINDSTANHKLLNFEYFDKIKSENYNKCFETPVMRFTAKKNDIVSHIEVGIKDLRSAINSITIGPKSNLTESDIKQLLIVNGLLKDNNDNGIIVNRSISSYR